MPPATIYISQSDSESASCGASCEVLRWARQDTKPGRAYDEPSRPFSGESFLFFWVSLLSPAFFGHFWGGLDVFWMFFRCPRSTLQLVGFWKAFVASDSLLSFYDGSWTGFLASGFQNSWPFCFSRPRQWAVRHFRILCMWVRSGKGWRHQSTVIRYIYPGVMIARCRMFILCVRSICSTYRVEHDIIFLWAMVVEGWQPSWDRLKSGDDYYGWLLK